MRHSDANAVSAGPIPNLAGAYAPAGETRVTIPAAPTTPATPPTPPASPDAPTPAANPDTNPFTLYGSHENGLIVRVPNAWRILEEGEIRLAPQAAQLVSPRASQGLPIVFIYTEASEAAFPGAVPVPLPRWKLRRLPAVGAVKRPGP